MVCMRGGGGERGCVREFVRRCIREYIRRVSGHTRGCEIVQKNVCRWYARKCVDGALRACEYKMY